MLAALQPLMDACAEFEIDTPLRIAAFLAQAAHESAGFTKTVEMASGEAYEYRKDLGNTFPGDGVKHKGRGYFQLTGKANYQLCGQDLGVNLVAFPELLEQPSLAARSAGWFWNKNKLNQLADNKEFERITKRINGGLNGLADRLTRYQAALDYLGA